MLKKIISFIGGDPNKKVVEKLSGLVEQINALEPQLEKLSDAELRARTGAFRARIREELDGITDEKEHQQVEQAVLEEILPEAFATVREASKRTIGLRHYDVQMLGGINLHRGNIAEMRTGEGKTLVATLPLYLNAITGRGVHLVTVNDYLARRDARWMGQIYHFLGLSVGVLQMAAVTENGKKAFLFDPERESTQEDKDKLVLVDRRLAYAADITYGTNNEFGFDYLRDNMTYALADRVQRGHYYAIVDEVDNVLIDEARTPLIISGPASGDLENYGRMAQLVRQLNPEDYEINEKDRNVALTDLGLAHVEQLLGQSLRDPDRPEDVTPEQARLLGYLEQALRAQFLFKRNKDYLVQGGKVIIVDEFTGRLMPGRRWSDGLHQAVEAKEGVKVEPENITYATITLQNYFRMYQKLAGMTGTALTEAEEFHKIYKLEVLPIPTNLEYNANRSDSPLLEVKAKDEQGYTYSYFARRTDPEKQAVFFRRKDYPDVIYRTVEAKLRAIVTEIVRSHVMGRPILVGTTSVESSDVLSNRLRAEPVRRLMQVLLLRRAWFDSTGKEEDGRRYNELVPLDAPLEKLEPAFLRQFAKPLEASLSAEDPSNLLRLLDILALEANYTDRLKSVLQGGVPHQVLNARKHTEESQIIAGAGEFGAVTIATNMAGRGVDIKLGGDLAEEVVAQVNRVLQRAGHNDPYDMPLDDRRAALQQMASDQFGLYETEVRFFLQYFENMERVRELGGLHVIGSERHESRRIDNQLRGRAARQGDPGSSRFYLSLEDELMRLFGGQQISGLMNRLSVDESLPLENRLVGSMIESSQGRVEGANFDVRKHLLEYDDVLNAQRTRIYQQRNRVFTKDDLTEDVGDLLRSEINLRVPEAAADPEGPWKLLAWLEQVQPTFATSDGVFPSYAYQLLLDELSAASGSPRQAILGLVQRAVEAENAHIQNYIDSLMARTAENLDTQIKERFDAIDAYLDAQGESEEIRRPQQALEELNAIVRLPLRLTTDQIRRLPDAIHELEPVIKDQVELFFTNQAASRVLGAIENRIGEPLELNRDQLMKFDWAGASEMIHEAAQSALEKRLSRLGSEHGQAARDLEALLAHEDPAKMDASGLVRVLGGLTLGRRTAFDAKTRRAVQVTYARFSYIFLAARLIEDESAEDLTASVLNHLETAQVALGRAWGQSEFARLWQNAQSLSDFGKPAETLFPNRLADSPAALSRDEQEQLAHSLGMAAQTDNYRRILLGAITELWVDYLTRVEALRVSIGLEAYAQRDPLVQYKAKASEMFQTLLSEIRTAVINRMFAYQPRQFALAPVESGSEPTPAPAQLESTAAPAKKKRRRH